MQTTYHLKAGEIDNNFISAIRTLFQKDEYLTITIESQIVDNSPGKADLLKFMEIEKEFPPTRVASDLDFNDVVDQINL